MQEWTGFISSIDFNYLRESHEESAHKKVCKRIPLWETKFHFVVEAYIGKGAYRAARKRGGTNLWRVRIKSDIWNTFTIHSGLSLDPQSHAFLPKSAPSKKQRLLTLLNRFHWVEPIPYFKHKSSLTPTLNPKFNSDIVWLASKRKIAHLLRKPTLSQKLWYQNHIIAFLRWSAL